MSLHNFLEDMSKTWASCFTIGSKHLTPSVSWCLESVMITSRFLGFTGHSFYTIEKLINLKRKYFEVNSKRLSVNLSTC